jgi:hypothetical protein
MITETSAGSIARGFLLSWNASQRSGTGDVIGDAAVSGCKADTARFSGKAIPVKLSLVVASELQ